VIVSIVFVVQLTSNSTISIRVRVIGVHGDESTEVAAGVAQGHGSLPAEALVPEEGDVNALEPR
jgi:hypothetical protein